jgi:hypothetical protein
LACNSIPSYPSMFGAGDFLKIKVEMGVAGF